MVALQCKAQNIWLKFIDISLRISTPLSYSVWNDGSFLEEFCRREAIDRLIHLDTDILSFGDFSEVEAVLEDCVSATCGTSPHVAVMSHRGIHIDGKADRRVLCR